MRLPSRLRRRNLPLAIAVCVMACAWTVLAWQPAPVTIVHVNAALTASLNCADASTRCVPSEYATIQLAMNAAVAGDTIWVAGGASYAGGNFASNGAAGQYITVLGDTRSGTVTITSNIGAGSHNHLAVQGVYLNGTTVTGSACSYLKIVGNTIDNTGACPSCSVGLEPSCDHVLIDGNTFGSHAEQDNIEAFGQFWIVRNNEAQGITETTQHPDFIQTFCTSREPLSYALIENNYDHDSTGADGHFFQFNNASCDLTTPANGSLGTTVYILRFNKTKNNGSLFLETNDDTVGVDNLAGIAVYNNTINQPGTGNNQVTQFGDTFAGGITFSPAFEKNEIAYNAMSAANEGFSFPVGVTLKNSLSFVSGSTVSAQAGWNLATCVTSGGCKINQDPTFTSFSSGNFSLQAGSPAIAAGTAMTTVASGCSGSTSSLTLTDAYAFQDGSWIDDATVVPDQIAVGTVGNTVAISAINYSTSVVTLANTISCSNGNNVWLYKDSQGRQVLTGTNLDMGGCPYGGASRLACQ